MSFLEFGRFLSQRSVWLTVRINVTRRNIYESAVSLKKLYPNSNLKLKTITEVPKKEGVKFSGYIPLEKLDFTYSRSSGPGGQHVNTNNTKVDVRFHVESATWIPEDLREKILDLNRFQINAAGYLIIRSEKTRSLQLNKADCLERLRKIIRTAEEPPPPGPSPDEMKAAQNRKDRADRKRIEEKRKRALDRKIALGLLIPD